MRFLLAALLFLVINSSAAAHGEFTKTFEPTEITWTMAQTLPYTFDPIDYTSGDTEDLDISFGDEPFINSVGSIAITIVQMVSEYALLSAIVLALLCILAMIWVYSIVVNQRIDTQLREINPDLEISQREIEASEGRLAGLRKGGSNVEISQQERRLAGLRENRRQLTERADTLQRARQDIYSNVRQFGRTARRFRNSRNPFN